MEGYEFIGGGCSDIDECQDIAVCDENASCSNIDGSFTCTCKEGYKGDGKSCEDVDECYLTILNTCGDAPCENTVGSFTCLCPIGQLRNDAGECVNDPCNATPGALEPANGGCEYTCTADLENNAAICSCPDGMTINSDNECIDADECVLNLHDCDENADCLNKAPGFECKCRNPYSGDGKTGNCKLAPCTHYAQPCHENAICTNVNDEDFECNCKSGFKGDGVTECKNILGSIEEPGPIKPEEDKEIGSLENVGHAWSLSFDFILRANPPDAETNSRPWPFQNVMRVEAGECCGHDSRIPAVHVVYSKEGPRLAVSYPIDSSTETTEDPTMWSDDYENFFDDNKYNHIRSWVWLTCGAQYHIEIKQEKLFGDKFVYKVLIDGHEQFGIENKNPKAYENVKAFVGKSSSAANFAGMADAEISNFVFQNLPVEDATLCPEEVHAQAREHCIENSPCEYWFNPEYHQLAEFRCPCKDADNTWDSSKKLYQYLRAAKDDERVCQCTVQGSKTLNSHSLNC